jgi:putative two-component system response regulator
MALKIIEKSTPDLIFLDIIMPDMDGYEVCRRIKADPKTKNIPIIFLTTKNEVHSEAEGYLLGATDYTHKPINAALLEASVKIYLAL